MNPFRTPSGTRDRLSALAERLILAMLKSSVGLRGEASTEALWALGISVAGWWLRSRSLDVEAELKPFAALPFLFGEFDTVRTLPDYAATASQAIDDADLAESGKRFTEVVSELGMTKLKAALGNPIFGRLQTQLLAVFPMPADLPEKVRLGTESGAPPVAIERVTKPVVAMSKGVSVSTVEGRSERRDSAAPIAAVGVRSVRGDPQRAVLPPVGEETLAFLQTRYAPEVVKRILKV